MKLSFAIILFLLLLQLPVICETTYTETNLTQKVYTVLAILEAKPGKEFELKEALISVANFSRAEKTCRQYRLHQDLTNKNIFFLYENWENKEVHQKQFEKSYIIELCEKLENLLAKPYQIIFADEL